MKTATLISNAIDVTNVPTSDLNEASEAVINRMNIEGVYFDEEGFSFNIDTTFETRAKVAKQFGYIISDDSEDEGLVLNAINNKYLQLLENELRFRGLL